MRVRNMARWVDFIFEWRKIYNFFILRLFRIRILEQNIVFGKDI